MVLPSLGLQVRGSQGVRGTGTDQENFQPHPDQMGTGHSRGWGLHGRELTSSKLLSSEALFTDTRPGPRPTGGREAQGSDPDLKLVCPEPSGTRNCWAAFASASFS